MCSTVYSWRRLVKAMEVTAGLVESNGSLPPGERLSHLWANTCIPESVPDPMLRYQYGRNSPFYHVIVLMC